MIVEVLRMHKTWLTGVVTGVNAINAAGTREAGDAAPPVLVEIVEETSDEATAGEQGMPANPPCLGMVGAVLGDAADPAMNEMGDGVVEVSIRYLTRQPNAAIARRDAAYTARGVIQSLRSFMSGANIASRQLRGIQLLQRTKLEFHTIYVPVGDGFASGLFVAHYLYRDVGFLP